ncbi:MAG: hypothetical protein WA958_11140 [Tunicatimonas sp.]
MNTVTIYEALRPSLGEDNTKTVANEIASVRELDTQRMKEIFATKVEMREELAAVERCLSDKIDSKINKIYWFLLGQTAILVGMILAILRLVDLV